MSSTIPSGKTIAIGLSGGVAHALLALWLGAFVRGQSFWAAYTPETLSGVVLLSSTVVGLVLLDGVPIALLYWNGFLIPIVTLSVLFTWAFYSSWRYFEASRTTGATSIDLYTDSLFGLLWFVPLAIVLLFGGIGYTLRRRGNSV